jgi:hypothetical protein
VYIKDILLTPDLIIFGSYLWQQIKRENHLLIIGEVQDVPFKTQDML